MVISILRGSSFEVDNHMVSSNLCDKFSITVETSDMEGHSEKSLWRFTLSLLKLRMEVSEIFVVDSAKDEEAGKIKIVCPAPVIQNFSPFKLNCIIFHPILNFY